MNLTICRVSCYYHMLFTLGDVIVSIYTASMVTLTSPHIYFLKQQLSIKAILQIQHLCEVRAIRLGFVYIHDKICSEE